MGRGDSITPAQFFVNPQPRLIASHNILKSLELRATPNASPRFCFLIGCRRLIRPQKTTDTKFGIAIEEAILPDVAFFNTFRRNQLCAIQTGIHSFRLVASCHMSVC